MLKTSQFASPFSLLLRRTAVALGVCIAVLIVCYYYIDRPVAYFVHRHAFSRFEGLRWLTEPPPIVQGWSPLVLLLLVIHRAFGEWRTWQRALFGACVSVVISDQFRESIGDVCGRYWPETWHHNNPSLIGSGAYGFRFFEAGGDPGSFPSGHSARISAFMAVWWIDVPRWRWLYAVISLPMLLSLIAMNYHFVSDVIAGTTLGAIVGSYAAALAGDRTNSNE